MSFAYDIVLNFNSDLFEFFEWKKEDALYHIKKIKIVRVNSVIYNDIYDNIVLFNKTFLNSISNSCELYTNRNINNILYAFLLTDTYRVIGLLLDKDGRAVKFSSLLPDEEEEILKISHGITNFNINYSVINKRIKDDFHTREEKSIIRFIKKDLTNEYKKKNISKLKFLYFEYFNKSSDDIDLIYRELISETDKCLCQKHYDLYQLIKLSYSKKNA